MPTHNPDCTHGLSHPYSACRDRFNQPLAMIEDTATGETLLGFTKAELAQTEPKPDQVSEVVLDAVDGSIKLLLAAAGNVIGSAEHQNPVPGSNLAQ